MKDYIPHKDRAKRIASAKTAITALLPLNLYLSHKRELLSACIWKITEADGKKNLRYWSEGALKTDNPKELIHEHVFERKELISRLLNGENIEIVTSDAIACIVTKSEHKILTTSELSGWKRYKDCNIRVYDLVQKDWSKL